MLKSFGYVLQHVRLDYGRLTWLAALSGLSNAIVLAIINVAAANAAEETRSHRFLILFLISITLYVVTQKKIMVIVADEIERVIHAIRVRLVQRVRSAEFEHLDDIGQAEIYTSITSETSVLSDASLRVVVAFQSAILVVFLMIYMALLSMTAFLLNLLFTAVGAAIHLVRSKAVNRELHAALAEENRMHDGMQDLLGGFKEVKLSSARGDELVAWIEARSSKAAESKTNTQRLHINDYVLSQVTFFLLTGTMVFLVPMLSDAYSDVVIKATATSLFLIGPVSNVVTTLPFLARARAAVESIEALEDQLENARRPEPSNHRSVPTPDEITLDRVMFRYGNGGEGFTVGPFELRFKRGETVFITGGNGSGKTTMIRLLLGLYRPHGGRVLADGLAIDDAHAVSYRNLFSAVFSDNHLFKILYGVESVDPREAADLFRMLEMDQKASLVDRTFDTVRLSGGQRKRLALIASILERKPYIVLDEWAADQDPHFRETFYTQIIPWMAARGMTIIAITHDDKYHDLADRRIELREGKIHRDIRLRADDAPSAAQEESAS
ncbi:MAG: cyclic peptide export ABC transporter [Acidobacteriota bacterium]